MTQSSIATGVPILVDTSVLIDVMTQDAEWSDWSKRTLTDAAATGPILINAIIYAEIAVRFDRETDLDETLQDAGIGRDPLPWSAAFLAGQAHQVYRRRGGARLATLPDFFIGAHAALRRYRLLTRDPRPQRTYFPTVNLICPPSV